jgi:hypothetical protein
VAGGFAARIPHANSIAIESIPQMMLGAYLSHLIFSSMVCLTNYAGQFAGAVLTFAASLAFVSVCYALSPQTARRFL